MCDLPNQGNALFAVVPSLAERGEPYMASRQTFGFVFFVLLCSGAAWLNAAETPPTTLLVLAKTDQTMFIVDPATQTVVGKVPAGPDPHEVIACADGKFAYISNYGGEFSIRAGDDLVRI